MSITVGQRASRSLTLTAEHVRKFAEISGDHNPRPPVRRFSPSPIWTSHTRGSNHALKKQRAFATNYRRGRGSWMGRTRG